MKGKFFYPIKINFNKRYCLKCKYFIDKCSKAKVKRFLTYNALIRIKGEWVMFKVEYCMLRQTGKRRGK